MLDEFILLLESEKEKVKEVLWPHLNEKIFKRLIGGFFDDSGKRFVAYAFIQVKKSKFYEYDYLFDLSNSSHSAVYFSPETSEKTKKFIDKNSFQYKSAKELIEEGIYKSLLISYLGEFDFGEWNILPDICFCDTNNKNILLESRIDRVKTTIKEYFFGGPIFQETLAHHNESMSRLIAKRKDSRIMPFPTEIKPFIGHSELVAMIRMEQSSKINLLFEDYIRKAIYRPLIITLKTRFPKKYRNVWAYYGQECNFLIPSHRKFCLIINAVVDDRKKTRLEFHVYSLQDNKIYEWIYFQMNPFEDTIDYDVIIKIFNPISQLNNMDYIIESKCNFDDDYFWNNFVFKKEDNRYVFLKEIDFK
jgi:hypothetical protein